MERFKDKTVIVTGAGSGIGTATAQRFAQEGATVALFGHSDSVEQALTKMPGDKAFTVKVDVRAPDNVKAAIDMVAERTGRIDVLVNNAGVAVTGPPDELTDEDWDKVLRTNVDGVFHCSRAAIPHLEKTGGCIVNTSSVSGMGGDWGMLAYNTSKGAVTNFTRALALDLGKRGIRVNAVAPSLTDTKMAQGILEDEEKLAKFKERMPLDPPAQPSDVAAVIAFLASDDARMVSGVILPVDGGVTAANGQPPLG